MDAISCRRLCATYGHKLYTHCHRSLYATLSISMTWYNTYEWYTQGDVESWDALSCRSFFAKEPLCIGLFVSDDTIRFIKWMLWYDIIHLSNMLSHLMSHVMSHVMSHLWMSPATLIDESWDTYEWVTVHSRTSLLIGTNESGHTCE